MRKIAIIGCGAIGAGVLELLKEEPGLSIGWVVLHEDAHGHADAQTAIHRFAPNAKVVPSLAADDRPDLLVECAGHSAIEEHLIPALQRGNFARPSEPRSRCKITGQLCFTFASAATQ